MISCWLSKNEPENPVVELTLVDIEIARLFGSTSFGCCRNIKVRRDFFKTKKD